jgi:hypothetical protein
LGQDCPALAKKGLTLAGVSSIFYRICCFFVCGRFVARPQVIIKITLVYQHIGGQFCPKVSRIGHKGAGNCWDIKYILLHLREL